MPQRQHDEEIQMDEDDRLTLIELIEAVDESADDQAEVMATLRYMFESGHVQREGDSLVDLPWAA